MNGCLCHLEGFDPYLSLCALSLLPYIDKIDTAVPI